MAKKIVKVNEEKIRGYMVGDIPDAIENEDIIGRIRKKKLPGKIPNLAICPNVTVTFVRSIW